MSAPARQDFIPQPRKVRCQNCHQEMTVSSKVACSHHFCISCIKNYLQPMNECSICGSTLPLPDPAGYSQAFNPPSDHLWVLASASPNPQYKLPGASWGDFRMAPTLPNTRNVISADACLPPDQRRQQYHAYPNLTTGAVALVQQVDPYARSVPVDRREQKVGAGVQQKGGYVAVAPQLAASSRPGAVEARPQQPGRQDEHDEGGGREKQR